MFPGELRAFHIVAQTGSIRKASEVLSIAPSSVSRKVALLEHQIGTTLLERTASGVVLTHAGTLVAEYARTVVLDYETLRADLNDRRGSRRRLISLAVVESALFECLLNSVAAFRSRFESVSFRVNMIPAPQVVEAVRRGECDVGLTFCCPPRSDVTIMAKIAEPIVLAVPNGHRLAGSNSVTLESLRDVSLALPDLSFGVRRIVDQACHDVGLASALNPAFSANSFEALRNFVRCGAGVAILPQRAVLRESRIGNLRMLAIDHASFKNTTIDIVTLGKRRIPRIVDEFIRELVREYKASVVEN